MTIVSLICYLFSLPKPITNYRVSSNGNYGVAVRVSYDNWFDDIIVPQGLSYSQIIQLTDSLNLTLNK